jgi:hypothetical protein
VAGPFWSKPLWDSDKNNDGESDGWFGAPNIMTIAKVAVSVAGGGPWAAFALDAFDTAFNVAAGNMSLKDGVTGLAKGAAVTAVSSFGVTQALGGAVGNTIANAGLGSVTASVASSMVTSYSTSLINGAINSLEFDGGLSFNKNKFRQSARDGIKGMAQAGITSLVSSSIMSAGGARWSNGRMGFTDATGRSLSIAQDWQKTITGIGSTAGALAGQAFSAATGDGFTLNYKGVLQLQLGGKNAGLSVGGGGVGLGAIDSMFQGLSQLGEMKDDAAVEFLLNNHNNKEGMARMTYVNWGIQSGNANAMKMADQIISGEKSLVFNKDLKEGHFGHAGIDNNEIQLNADAMNIGQNTLSKAGFFTSVMAREGYLIDKNQALGYGDSDKLSPDVAKQLTLDAFKMQSGVLGDIAGNMGVRFGGQWGGMKTIVDQVAKTGDLFGQSVTGRDFHAAGIAMAGREMGFYKSGDTVVSKSAFYLKQLVSGDKRNSYTVILNDGSLIKNREDGGISIIDKNGKETKLQGHSDFQRLLDGAGKAKDENGQLFDSYGYVDHAKGTDDFLGKNVSAYYSTMQRDIPRGDGYSGIEGGGNQNAKNIRGGGRFNYQRHGQTLLGAPPDTKYYGYAYNKNGQLVFSPRGLECEGATAFHVFKSLGLVPPDLSRDELAELYTHIYSKGTMMGEGREIENQVAGAIPSMYNNALRGRAGNPRLGPEQIVDLANNYLRNSDWAKLTGMNNTEFSYSYNSSTISSKLNEGFIGGITHKGQYDGRTQYHVMALVDNYYSNARRKIIVDDSLRRAQGVFTHNNDYRNPWVIYSR